MTRYLASIAGLLFATVVFPAIAHAQVRGPVRPWLALDTVLAPAERVGCEAMPALGTTAPNPVMARSAWREAQDALLEGNRRRAQEKLEESLAADPRDARAWLDLSDVRAQLVDSTGARMAACRVLVMEMLTPTQRESAEQRWRRLLTPEMATRTARALRQHSEGLRLARQGAWTAARRAFDEVIQLAPSAPAAWRNRAIVAAEAGETAAARRDLERYVQLGPPPEHRLALARALNALQRPQFDVGTAVAAGLIPGGAQFATGRPAFGALVLTAATGSAVLAMSPRTRERTVPFIDPNGESAPYTEQYRVYPYRAAGIGIAVGVLVAAMVEGGLFAARSSRLPTIVATRRGPAVRLAWGRDPHRR